MSEICSYCGQPGHWRPDCPEIAWLRKKPRPIRMELASTPIVARTRKLKARWRAEVNQDLEAFCNVETRMKQVRVNKSKLLAILKKNRDEHRGIFLEAQQSFRKAAIRALDAQLLAARTEKPFDLSRLVCLTAPQDHTADYDRSIQMLEMSVDKQITVDEREFQNYVQDIWNWSRDWATSNIGYVSKESKGYGKLSALASSD